MEKLRPVILPKVLAREDCERLRASVPDGIWREGGLVGGVADPAIRRAGLAWVDDIPGADWIGDRLAAIIAEANRVRFGFDLTDFSESAQIARYGAERQGHFHWHSDIGDGRVAARRKLTVVMQLSDPGVYEGGALQTWSNAEPDTHPRGLGDAVVFPSFLLHRVTPVVRGERWSLTQWVHGPDFR